MRQSGRHQQGYDAQQIDLPTVAAIGIVAYVLVVVAHETLGHGGACVALGSRPEAFSAFFMRCDERLLSTAQERWLTAGGSIANLLCGALALWALLRSTRDTWRLMWWLLALLSLGSVGGYWIISGLLAAALTTLLLVLVLGPGLTVPA
jgi:hypothetical protein